MGIGRIGFEQELKRRIGETFPRKRLPFFGALDSEPAYEALGKIHRIIRDEERAWHLFLVALHVLYEGWHELPPLTVVQRKQLLRTAVSLRAIAGDLRKRRLEAEGDKESATMERMAKQLEWMVRPSADWIYRLKASRGARFDPRDAVPIFELEKLFREPLAECGVYPVIVDLMNAFRGRTLRYSVQTVKNKIAALKKAGFQPRVTIAFPREDIAAIKTGDVHIPPPLRNVP